MKTINVGEAKSRFSELISRAAAGERFLIRRRERPMAVLISSTELERLERTSQAARRLALALGQDAELLRQVEAKRFTRRWLRLACGTMRRSWRRWPMRSMPIANVRCLVAG